MGQGRVLVTGATGFVAGQCIAELLARGYDVRGTVRDLATADVAHLRPLADRDGSLQFAAARLDADEGWAEAADGCDFVLHVASPIPFKAPKDENEIIRPAVDGTLRVLNAAAKAGVRRVVCTGSTDAIAHNSRTADRVRTEDDWSDPAECGAYAKSKIMAERAAREFADDHSLELATVLPGAVIGPPMRVERASSADIVRRMLAREMPLIPRLSLAFTDVRDLAVAHRLALETPGAAGNRYICAGEDKWLRDVAAVLAAEYGPRGYRVSTRRLPSWLLRAAGPFSSEAKLAISVLGIPHVVSADKARRELGWVPRPFRESVIDTAESLLGRGLIVRR
jgi:nucleoside-diphosphate-sugar epimerase